MTSSRVARAAGGFVRHVRLAPDTDVDRYPFSLPMVRWLSRAGGLDVDGSVTFEIKRLDADPDSPPLLPAYGGVSPHERSHGESFLDLVIHRFGPDGLYLLDEPEAALSVRGVQGGVQIAADQCSASQHDLAY